MKLLADCYRETNFKSECKQVPEPEANSIYCLAEIFQTLALADNVDKKGKEEKAQGLFRDAAELYRSTVRLEKVIRTRIRLLSERITVDFNDVVGCRIHIWVTDLTGKRVDGGVEVVVVQKRYHHPQYVRFSGDYNEALAEDWIAAVRGIDMRLTSDVRQTAVEKHYTKLTRLGLCGRWRGYIG